MGGPLSRVRFCLGGQKNVSLQTQQQSPKVSVPDACCLKHVQKYKHDIYQTWTITARSKNKFWARERFRLFFSEKSSWAAGPFQDQGAKFRTVKRNANAHYSHVQTPVSSRTCQKRRHRRTLGKAKGAKFDCFYVDLGPLSPHDNSLDRKESDVHPELAADHVFAAPESSEDGLKERVLEALGIDVRRGPGWKLLQNPTHQGYTAPCAFLRAGWKSLMTQCQHKHMAPPVVLRSIRGTVASIAQESKHKANKREPQKQMI